MTETEIKAKYKKLHDTLTSKFYSGKSKLSKEEFDLQHGKIWSDMEVELIAEGYLRPSEPTRDLLVEIDALRARIEELEKKRAKSRFKAQSRTR